MSDAKGDLADDRSILPVCEDGCKTLDKINRQIAHFSLVVGKIIEYSQSPVYLFGEHKTEKLMGEGHSTEG